MLLLISRYIVVADTDAEEADGVCLARALTAVGSTR
jgi:hypothetical protein